MKINPVVARGDPVEIFTSDYWKDTISLARTLYRPVTVLTFAIERRFAGEADPGLSHLVDLLLHALTALLLFRFALRAGAGRLGASASALLFCAHPLLLQAVANVVGRADILAALFSLAALLCFAHAGPWAGAGGEAAPGWRVRLAAWGAGLFALLAAGSKEVGLAVFPLLAVTWLLYRRPALGQSSRRWIDTAATAAPLVLALLVYLQLRTVAIGEFPGWQPLAREDNVLVGLSGLPRWATALAMLARYAGLLLWPRNLSPDYSGSVIRPESSLLAPAALVGLLLLALLVALALRPWLPARRAVGDPSASRIRATAMAAWLFVLPYMLIGNLLVLNAAGFAERMIYFSATGACLLAGLGIERLAALAPERRRAAALRAGAAAVAVLVVAGIVETRRQLPMWATNEALFAWSRRVAPRGLRANLALAGELEASGRADEALAVYEQVNQNDPDYGGAWMARGLLLAKSGDLGGAEQALRRAVAADPMIGQAQMNLGLVLARTGDLVGADRALRKALLLDPGLVKAAAQLGHLRYREGRYAEAAHFYRGCVELGREDLRGRLEEALVRARAAATKP